VLICCVSLQWLDMAFAPVPRCSPFIGPINKLVESNSLTADFNPYFPVPPCEHGGPLQAVLAGDFESVFLLARPEKIPRHNIYEGKWLHTEGPRRLARILAGEEEIKFDPSILLEGYSHNRGTQRIGLNSHRDPSLIDNTDKFQDGLRRLINDEVQSSAE